MRRVLTCIAVIASVLGNSYGMNFSQTEESGSSSQGSDPITVISKRTVRQLGEIGSRLDIPEVVRTIGFAAFSKNPIIGEVSIPSSVISIGGCAFHLCAKLSKVVISPESLLENIGDSAFKDCENLKSIFLPTFMRSIGSSAFENTGITNIILPGMITVIPKRAFAMCRRLEKVEMGDRVTSIKDQASFGCESLQTVIVPTSVVDIDPSAFSDCPSLSEQSQASIMAAYNRQEERKRNEDMQAALQQAKIRFGDLLRYMEDAGRKNPKLWEEYKSLVTKINQKVADAIEDRNSRRELRKYSKREHRRTRKPR